MKIYPIKLNRRLMAGGFLGLFLMVLAMVIFPHLHEIIHKNAHEEDHSCTVTLILTGAAEAPLSPQHFEFISNHSLLLEDTQPFQAISFFLSGYIPEHAPPVVS